MEGMIEPPRLTIAPRALPPVCVECANFSLPLARGKTRRACCRDRQGETVRLRDALNRLFGEALADVSLLLSLAPIPFTIAMMASAMPAVIRQSSTAATPDSPVRNLQNIFIEPFIGVAPFVGPKPEEAIKPSAKIGGIYRPPRRPRRCHLWLSKCR